MRRLFIISFILFCCHSLAAQVNYVLNPGLEEYTHCPLTADEIMYAKHWSPIDSTWHIYGVDTQGNASCSAEYCNTCDTFLSSSLLTLPANPWFNHYPRTGNGMAHVLMFVDSSLSGGMYLRDYLQGRLYQPLIAGKSYCVSFYVVLTHGGSMYAVNHIGAYLDDGHIDAVGNNCGLVQTQCTPQVLDTGIVYDSLNWTKIDGSFTATGTERFITIGNFFDLVNTEYVVMNTNALGGEAYYLIDDISVIESDTKAYAGPDVGKGIYDSVLLGRDEIIPGIKWWRDGVLIDTLHAGLWCKDTVPGLHTYILSQTLCGVTTWDTVLVTVWPLGIPPGPLKAELKIYPNPAGNTIYIDAAEKVNATILSLDGRILLNSPDAKSIDISSLAPGCYLLRVYDEQGILLQTEKLLKMSR